MAALLATLLCSCQTVLCSPPPPPPHLLPLPFLCIVAAMIVKHLSWLQVALFDRIHNIRVKHIQEEYQKYMERVRSKAQSAIDQANANYQHHRAMLTARVDTMVHYLQQQYLRVSIYPHCILSLAALLRLLSLSAKESTTG